MANKFPHDCSPCYHPRLLHTCTITSLTSFPATLPPSLSSRLPCLLHDSHLSLVHCWPRAFALTVPSAWNVLPLHICVLGSFTSSGSSFKHSDFSKTEIPLSVSQLYPHFQDFFFSQHFPSPDVLLSFNYFLVCCLSPPPGRLTPCEQDFLFICFARPAPGTEPGI